jgi:hypothetical protein
MLLPADALRKLIIEGENKSLRKINEILSIKQTLLKKIKKFIFLLKI